jgi:hypothetical protein
VHVSTAARPGPEAPRGQPPAKAQKRFVNGQENNLVAYYEALKTM